MQFLDAIGLASFWKKIKDWANSCFFSKEGGEINPKSGLQYMINGEHLGITKSGNENETIDIFDVDENGMKAISIVKTGGTATQVLMADGSVKEVGGKSGIAGLDTNGNVPLANLGNLDTTVAEVVTALPTSNIKRHIYLVKDSDTANNKYAEYVYTGDISAAYDSTKWEKLGDFRATVDLADYAKKDEALHEFNAQYTLTSVYFEFKNVNGAPISSFELYSASSERAGLMMAPDKNKLDGIAKNANNYSLPTASSTTKGGITLGYSQSGKNYPVALDGNGKAYVNVPWTDTNTTYDLSPYAKTADVNAALAKKVDVVSGKGLSTEDFTAALKTKLNGIATGATADSAIPISVIDALN
ncbi:hypothetical protein [Segatella copri]|nr:hypothetical protein [Segatella copri]MQM89728.1 hypothetical protein [Segatella copri]MQM94807.1 hypothetical protein [Segatella copri]MQO37037.1 hypothetical protein [Segatella copri]